MLTSRENPIHPLLSTSLQALLSSRAPGKKLAVSMITIPSGLNGSEKELAELWLTDEERTQFAHFTFAKRKYEWLSGRICAKQATIDLLKSSDQLGAVSAHDFSIISNSSGRPFVNPKKLPFRSADIDISISHSHDMAVGLAGYGRCGIDIQFFNETLFKVRHRFCADVEAAILDQLPADELVQLGLLWVAKEAIRKCFSGSRIVGFRELKLFRAVEEHDHYNLKFQSGIEGITRSSDSPLSVIARHDDSYGIAVCTAEKEKRYAGTA